MEFHFVDIIQHIINIVVLFLILRSLVYKPVLEFIQARNEGIKQEQLKVEADRQAAEELNREASARFAQSNAEAEETVAASIARAEAAAQAKIREAEIEIAAMKAKAEAQIMAEIAAQRETAQAEVQTRAVKLAAEIIAREIRVEDNEALITKFFQKAQS